MLENPNMCDFLKHAGFFYLNRACYCLKRINASKNLPTSKRGPDIVFSEFQFDLIHPDFDYQVYNSKNLELCVKRAFKGKKELISENKILKIKCWEFGIGGSLVTRLKGFSP